MSFFPDFDNFSSCTSADVKVMSEKEEWCLSACLWQHVLYVEYCIKYSRPQCWCKWYGTVAKSLFVCNTTNTVIIMGP